MTVVVNYTNEELEDIQCKLDTLFSKLTCRVAREKLYGLTKTNRVLLKEIFQYKWVLSQWQQNPNGTTTDLDNYFDLEEFNKVIFRIKELVC